MTIETIRN